MALKIKMSPIGILDMLKFKNLPQTRDKIIEKYPAKNIEATYVINEKAKKLHPDFQHLVIDEVIDHKSAQAKTFVLKTTDGEPAAYFRAGQYLSVLLNINGSVVTRPYSISSSPKWSKEGKYAITVRKSPNGFASQWILDNWKKGNNVTVSAAEGNFYYDELRDSQNVIALAGGSGITPFLSMAYAIRDGLESFNLTIIFGSRKEENILFKNELDKISSVCSKVKVVHVLSDENKDGYENGFITAELIKKYAPGNDYSVFICGPEAMYKFLEKEINKLSLERKAVRRELLGVTKNVSEHEGYPSSCKNKTYSVTVKQGTKQQTISASADETVLAAIERAGINAPSRCRSGECGWCRSKLVSGTVFVPEENEGRRAADKINNYIHPCASFPTSDLVIEVPGSYLK